MALLLVMAVLDVVGAAALAARLLPPPRPARDRAAAAALLALFLPVVEVRALGAVGALTSLGVAAATAAIALAALAASGAKARACARRDAGAALAAAAAALGGSAASAGAWIGLLSLALGGLAAYLLPPWAWDALGYHLPIVQDALRTHALRDVPTHILYVNAYPRAIELFFIACRLLLGSDTLLDFCQAPFALAACVGVAALARRAGAPAARAAAYGALFLAVPLVVLQVATNYVDIAVAALLVLSVYFATGPTAPVDLALFGIATGFLLASKPSAPPAAVILCAFVLVRGRRARTLGPALAACALALVVGGEKYLENLVRHHNPVWPVSMHLGPLALPGVAPAGPMFVLGLPEPYAHYGWLRRLLASIAATPDRYIYDMRVGGLGPLVAAGLVPIAIVSARRTGRRALPMALLAAAAVASPAAHWMRYTLALPAALLAHAAVATARLRRGPRVALDLGLAALAALGVAQASPGLTDSGPSLAAVLAMPAEQRAAAVGVDGHERLWREARRLVRDGEAFAYDASFSFPGQLWRGDGGAGLLFLEDERSPDDVAAALSRVRVRVLVAGDGRPAAEAVRRSPERYRLLFRCPVDPCNVYERVDELWARGAPANDASNLR